MAEGSVLLTKVAHTASELVTLRYFSVPPLPIPVEKGQVHMVRLEVSAAMAVMSASVTLASLNVVFIIRLHRLRSSLVPGDVSCTVGTSVGTRVGLGVGRRVGALVVGVPVGCKVGRTVGVDELNSDRLLEQR